MASSLPAGAAVEMRTLSKEGTGRIMLETLNVELRSNPVADKTADLLPDGSRLLSDDFSRIVDGSGVGTFAATARFVDPNGDVVIRGTLRGIAGLTTARGADSDPRRPGHFEGVFESGPIPPDVPTVPTLVASFSVDELPTMGPIPTYAVRLDGILTGAPIPADAVTLSADRAVYGPSDPIVASLHNGLDQTITVIDQQSFCTLVTLQIRTSTGWEMIGGCPLASIPRPTPIAPGETKTMTLPTAVFGGDPREPGTYRLTTTYTVVGGAEGPKDAGTAVFSSEFTVTSAAGGVTIAADKASYATTDPIHATLTNNRPESIVLFDEQSYCSVLTLKRESGDGWVFVGDCPLDRIPMPAVVKPGETLAVTLPTGDYGGNDPRAPGNYRLSASYQIAGTDGKPTGDAVNIYSAVFAVAEDTAKPLVMGDMNGDGRVTIADVILSLRVVVGLDR